MWFIFCYSVVFSASASIVFLNAFQLRFFYGVFLVWPNGVIKIDCWSNIFPQFIFRLADNMLSWYIFHNFELEITLRSKILNFIKMKPISEFTRKQCRKSIVLEYCTAVVTQSHAHGIQRLLEKLHVVAALMLIYCSWNWKINFLVIYSSEKYEKKKKQFQFLIQSVILFSISWRNNQWANRRHVGVQQLFHGQIKLNRQIWL